MQTNRYVPSLVSWNLTRKCNLKCPHCYMEGGIAEERELTTEECFSLIDEMHSLGTEMLILTGGEPLLRRDIFDIARRASSLGMWVVMGTNGVLIRERVIQKMIECGVKGVGISIDSVDPEKHNAFRGGPNSWEFSINALKLCKSYGMQVLVQTTVMEENYEEVEQVMDLAKSLGAWSFNLYFLVQTGRGTSMNELSSDRTDSMLRRLVALQDDYRPMLVRSKCAPQFKQIAYDLGEGGLESGGCMAGTQYCRITPGGDVTPCPYMTKVAGNVLKNSLTSIWNGSDVFADLRDPSRLGGKCGSCEFKDSCGGCRCRAYARFGDYLAEDPACVYLPTGREIPSNEYLWTRPALDRLERIPISFIRSKVRKGVETFAGRHGSETITMELMQQALSGAEREYSFPIGATGIELPDA